MRELVLMSGLALAFLAGDEDADDVVTATEDVMTEAASIGCCWANLDVVDDDEVVDDVVWLVVEEDEEEFLACSYLQ